MPTDARISLFVAIGAAAIGAVTFGSESTFWLLLALFATLVAGVLIWRYRRNRESDKVFVDARDRDRVNRANQYDGGHFDGGGDSGD
jgi:membrane protein implicated in regulation of membrane protease activity